MWLKMLPLLLSENAGFWLTKIQSRKVQINSLGHTMFIYLPSCNGYFLGHRLLLLLLPGANNNNNYYNHNNNYNPPYDPYFSNLPTTTNHNNNHDNGKPVFYEDWRQYWPFLVRTAHEPILSPALPSVGCWGRTSASERRSKWRQEWVWVISTGFHRFRDCTCIFRNWILQQPALPWCLGAIGQFTESEPPYSALYLYLCHKCVFVVPKFSRISPNLGLQSIYGLPNVDFGTLINMFPNLKHEFATTAMSHECITELGCHLKKEAINRGAVQSMDW